MSKTFPKVLVAAPTANVKRYCFEDWLKNTLSFKYPNYDIRLFDNSLDEANEYTHRSNMFYIDNYGTDEKFRQIHSLSETDKKRIKSVRARMAISHDDARKYALKHGYDYLLHLETDVFPEPDVIERLIMNRKKVCGALFYRDEGEFRRLMLQRRIFRSPHNIVSQNFERQDDLCFVDGTLKKVSSVGLGCVLIHRSVLKKIEFRHDPKQDVAPDSLFAHDCYSNGIQIWADTSLLCEHQNQPWEFVSFKSGLST